MIKHIGFRVFLGVILITAVVYITWLGYQIIRWVREPGVISEAVVVGLVFLMSIMALIFMYVGQRVRAVRKEEDLQFMDVGATLGRSCLAGCGLLVSVVLTLVSAFIVGLISRAIKELYGVDTILVDNPVLDQLVIMFLAWLLMASAGILAVRRRIINRE
ncbi:MAG: hypothetical protein ACOCXQ_01500 [Patescibacteria group bacterium]